MKPYWSFKRLQASKSSPLDFIPTSLLKASRGVFAPIIARLANLTFDHRCFPATFKLGVITPLHWTASDLAVALTMTRYLTNIVSHRSWRCTTTHCDSLRVQYGPMSYNAAIRQTVR